MPERANIEGWDAIARIYQEEHLISLDDIHYGPLCPGERELKLLGDIEKKRVLDLGCGGGQNAVVLAKWKAHVVAMDPSREQLKFAHRLCQGLPIHLVRGKAEQLAAFRKGSFDLVLSSLSLDFVADMEEVIRQVYRILKPQGRFVFSMIHPIMNCIGWFLMEDLDTPEIENYFEMKGAKHSFWDFKDGTRCGLYHYQHTLEELFSLLLDQGFRVTAVREPRPYDLDLLGKKNLDKIPYMYRDFDPKSLFFQVMQSLPYTLIIQAQREISAGGE